MKYIIYKDQSNKEHAVLFPEEISHRLMMAHTLAALRTSLRQKGEGMNAVREFTVVAAGFVTIQHTPLPESESLFDMTCHGESETLGIKSRGDDDLVPIFAGCIR